MGSFYYYYWTLVLIGTLVGILVAKFAPPLELKVTAVYKYKATLTVVSASEQDIHQECTLNYIETESKVGKYVNLANYSQQEVVTLTGLNPATNYTVTLQCDSDKYVVTFVTEPLDNLETTTFSGPDVVYKESQLFSASTLDIVLGVLFGIVAVSVVSVTLLYIYRRHQRRQRLRNFLRTPHTDPFESLQDYVE